MRTERNIAHPASLWKKNGADLLEAYQFAFAPLGGGTSKVSVYFNHFILTCQLLMAILSGLGKAGILAGVGAKAQVRTINGMQFTIFLYVWCLFPAHDRVDNLMFACQFALEGTMTAILSNQGEGDFAEIAQSSAFILSLVALAVPLLRRFYDGIIVQCIKMRRKGPFNRKAAALAMLIFFLQLQSTILKLVGISSAEASLGSGVVSSAAKLVNREATAGALGASAIVEVGAMLSADAYALMFGSEGPKSEHHHAVRMIQKMERAKQGRERARNMRRCLVLIQKVARAMLARRLVNRLRAATKIQAHQRGRMARRYVAAFTAVKLASWASADASFQSRPGFLWVSRQEAVEVAKERVERIKNSLSLSASHLSFPRKPLERSSSAARPKISPGQSLTSSRNKPLDEELTESSESEDVLPAGDNEHLSVAGVVFTQHEMSQVSATRQETAISALPDFYPPDYFEDVTRLQVARDTLLDEAESVWEAWIKPGILLFLGHAFVGTQTFPPRPKEQVRRRQAQTTARLLQRGQSKARMDGQKKKQKNDQHHDVNKKDKNEDDDADDDGGDGGDGGD